MNLDLKKQLEEVVLSAKNGNFDGLNIIVQCLRHDNYEVRLRAASCCKQIGFSGGVEALGEMALRDPESINRNAAIYGLVGVGRPMVVPILIDALGDEDDDRWDDAQSALYRLLGKQVLPMLADEHETVEGEQTEVERLRDWWQERSSNFRSDYVYYNGELASPGAFVEKLKITSTPLPDAVLNALTDWTGQDFGQQPLPQVLSEWERWWAENSASYEPGRRYFYGYQVPMGKLG